MALPAIATYIMVLIFCLLSEPIVSFNIVINKQGKREYQD